MRKYNDFYKLLSRKNQKLFNEIENHEILGASKHLEIIGNMLIDIADNGLDKNLETIDVINHVNNLGLHYQITRGSASRSVYNGIHSMLNGIEYGKIKKNSVLLDKLKDNIDKFNKVNDTNLNKILEYAESELKEFKNILLYDYSSTVEKTIIRIVQGTEKNIKLYVSESSAIDGGKPFLNLNEYDNIDIVFFPDASLYYMLQQVDCCLMGAETFYPDGTGFNTIGSDMVGVLCKELALPLYFITPLSKLDIRRKYGKRKKLVYVDYKNKYKKSNLLTSDINTYIPELIGVDSKNIYAYICEEGVIPSDQMFQISIDYDENLRGCL